MFTTQWTAAPPGFPVPHHLPEFAQVHVLVLQTEERRRRGWQGDEMIGWHHRFNGKRRTEDEIIGWYHQLEGHEFEQVLGNGEGQGSLVCCNLWDYKESDTIELN